MNKAERSRYYAQVDSNWEDADVAMKAIVKGPKSLTVRERVVWQSMCDARGLMSGISRVK